MELCICLKMHTSSLSLHTVVPLPGHTWVFAPASDITWLGSAQTGVLLNFLRNPAGKKSVPDTCQSKCSFSLAEKAAASKEKPTGRAEGLHGSPTQPTRARCQLHSCLSKQTSTTKIKIPHAEKGKKFKMPNSFTKIYLILSTWKQKFC